MSSMHIELDLNEFRDVKSRLARAARLAQDMRPMLRRCMPIIRRSLDTTFKVGGRPQKWPPRWNALEDLFPRLRGKAPLLASGRLRQAVIQGNATVLSRDSLFFGTNLEYAPKQHFGGPSTIQAPKKKIKTAKDGHKYVVMHGGNGWFAKKVDADGKFTINVRARPFMHLVDEDVDAIMHVFRTELMAPKNQPPSGGADSGAV